jgi:hypothetical protein
MFCGSRTHGISLFFAVAIWEKGDFRSVIVAHRCCTVIIASLGLIFPVGQGNILDFDPGVATIRRSQSNINP